jgi:hypothetical protein
MNTKGNPSFYRKSHAIIIGITKYLNEDSLPNAANDARSVRNTLNMKYSFDNISLLLDHDATYSGIRSLLIDVLSDEETIKPEDRVVLYYSGHGKLKNSIGYSGEEVTKGYIIPYDSEKGKYSSYLEMETFVQSCQSCPAKHVFLILDCCYSGYAALRGQPPKPLEVTNNYIKDISERRALQILAAGQQDQPVSDSGLRPGHSAFTGSLLDFLESDRDPDNDGILTASEIGQFMEKTVMKHANTSQRPIYTHLAGSGYGDLIFKVYKNYTNPTFSSTSTGEQFIEQSVDFSRWVEIHDCGSEGSTAGQSAVTAMETSLAIKGRKKGNDRIKLSARYVYEKGKKLLNFKGDRGMFVGTAAMVIQQYGAPLEQYWPYIPNKADLPKGMTWRKLDNLAAEFRAVVFQLRSLKEIPMQLKYKRPIIAGVTVYGAVWDKAKDNGIIGRHSKNDHVMGGQAITIVGYDHKNDTIKFANDWGKEWGNGGFGSMDFKLAQELIDSSIFAVDVLSPIDISH